tara:strand:+ start:120 stop:356 length:237 start_codon:yes stop_codon:yes gene_type:complete
MSENNFREKINENDLSLIITGLDLLRTKYGDPTDLQEVKRGEVNDLMKRLDDLGSRYMEYKEISDKAKNGKPEESEDE